jgi:transposase, IS30 family
MTTYTHLSSLERKEIGDMKRRWYSLRKIAWILERNVGTISRELKRNSIGSGYDPPAAKAQARVRRMNSKYQGMKIESDRELRSYVIEKLEAKWTPEMISGRLKFVEKEVGGYISTKGIYRWIESVWWQRYQTYLFARKKTWWQRKKRGRKTMIPHRVSIHERPVVAEDRDEVWHWEIDTMVSGKKTGSKVALCVMVDRMSRYSCIERIPNLKGISMNRAIIKRLYSLPRETLTYDNGVENTRHFILRPVLTVVTFFCDAYSSWQKGTVENTIGRIRRTIPKGSDVGKWSKKQIQKIEDQLNQTPKKCLNYKTPLEVITEEIQSSQKQYQPGTNILSIHDG